MNHKTIFVCPSYNSYTIKFQKRYIKKNLDVVINRGSDNGFVIIFLDEYNSLRTTQHELSSKKNIERLDSVLEKFDKGKSTKKNQI